MITLNVNKNNLSVKGEELMTSKSLNVNYAQFIFSEEWEGLKKMAVFQTTVDGVKKTYSLEVENEVPFALPWELFVTFGNTIFAGVYGIKDGEIVLPTEYKRLGAVKESVLETEAIPSVPWDPNDPAAPPSGEGTSDHRRLTHRDSAAQHPISSIEGLTDMLETIPEGTRPITNAELEAMLS